MGADSMAGVCTGAVPSARFQGMGRIAYLLVLVVALGACSTVAPYEKERLARPDMLNGRNADARSGQDHATAYREGASGAQGSAGGGCGCN